MGVIGSDRRTQQAGAGLDISERQASHLDVRWPGLFILLAGCSSAPEPLPQLDDAHRDLRGALAVFPGAEGFGTDTAAGRGGRILVVDTLADSGPGSLRDALAAAGPRTVVFAVGGVIDTSRNFEIVEPFVTVAGQSAPSPGITVSGAGLSVRTTTS